MLKSLSFTKSFAIKEGQACATHGDSLIEIHIIPHIPFASRLYHNFFSKMPSWGLGWIPAMLSRIEDICTPDVWVGLRHYIIKSGDLFMNTFIRINSLTRCPCIHVYLITCAHSNDPIHNRQLSDGPLSSSRNKLLVCPSRTFREQ